MSYPFDSSGILSTNKIPSETHVVHTINGINHNYIIPKAAPFYTRSMAVFDIGRGKILKENEDFYFIHPYAKATDETGMPVNGGLAFIDPETTGSFALTYQTLGEGFVDPTASYIKDGIDTLESLLTLDWADMADVPETFPLTIHKQRLDSVEGMSDFLAKIQSLVEAVRAPKQITKADIVDYDADSYNEVLAQLGTVAQSIATLSIGQNLSVQHFDTMSRLFDFDIVAPAAGLWYPTDVEITVPKGGDYLIEFSGNPKAITNYGGTAVNDVRMRWSLDGEEVASGRLPKSKAVLAEGSVVRLELATDAPGDIQRITFNGKTYGVGLTLTLVRSLT